jgi:uncharacterized membrane protein (Fun14 family)
VAESGPQTDQVQHPSPRPLWRSKSLLIAVTAMILGLGLWARDSFNRRAVNDDRSPVLSSLTESRPPSPADLRSSALFRLGFSYAGGFLIGWLFRKSLKLALLAAGALALAIAAGKFFDVLHLDWTAIEAQTAQGLAWFKGELGAFRGFLTGYLPSAAVGFVGMYKGARHH